MARVVRLPDRGKGLQGPHRAVNLVADTTDVDNDPVFPVGIDDAAKLADHDCVLARVDQVSTGTASAVAGGLPPTDTRLSVRLRYKRLQLIFRALHNPTRTAMTDKTTDNRTRTVQTRRRR